MIKASIPSHNVVFKLYLRKACYFTIFSLLTSTLVMGSEEESDTTPEPSPFGNLENISDDVESEQDITVHYPLFIQKTSKNNNTDNELEDMREAIAKINFKAIKTPKEDFKGKWKKSPYKKLNDQLKEIQVALPEDKASQDFLQGKDKSKTITKMELYYVLKKMLHKPDEITPATWPEPIVRAVDQALSNYAKNKTKEIKGSGINNIFQKCLGERYYIFYCKEAIQVSHLRSYYDSQFIHAYKSCDDDENVPFYQRESFIEFYGDLDDDVIEDTGTVVEFEIGKEDGGISSSHYLPIIAVFTVAGASPLLRRKATRPKGKDDKDRASDRQEA